MSGLFGRNGAGKTTLIKVLARQAPCPAGTLRVFGLTYADREREIKNRLGYVPQDPVFYPDRSVEGHARFAAAYFARWDGGCFHHLLDEFKLNPLKQVKHLSRGQQKLLSLALALSHGADLLLLDEPTAGLDVIVRRALLRRLRAFVADGERAVLVASHLTEGLDDITDEVSFIDDGRIVVQEGTEALLARWKWIHFRNGALPPGLEDRLVNVRRQPSAVAD